MKISTPKILMILQVLAIILMAGIIIKAGAITISYVVSISNPVGAKNLYEGWNLSSIHQFDFWHYTGAISLMVSSLAFEAYAAYLVAKVLSKIKLETPFTVETAGLLEKISYVTLMVWVVGMVYNNHMRWVMKKVVVAEPKLFSSEFILLAGLVFVFAQIFKRGVELQSENDLTV